MGSWFTQIVIKQIFICFYINNNNKKIHSAFVFQGSKKKKNRFISACVNIMEKS